MLQTDIKLQDVLDAVTRQRDDALGKLALAEARLVALERLLTAFNNQDKQESPREPLKVAVNNDLEDKP